MRPSKLTQRTFVSKIGDESVVWVRPSRVIGHIGTKWPVSKARLARAEGFLPKALVRMLRPAIRQREPFAVPGAYFNDPTPIADTPLYHKIADFLHRSGAVEDTAWFWELAQALERDGVAWHKDIAMRHRDDIRGFFHGYVIPLIDSLRRDGFVPEKTGYESAAVIDAQGRLSKTGSGNHRFAMCHLLDLPRFPLRVVAAHADWCAREVTAKGDDLGALKAALLRVEAAHQ